MNHYQKYVTNLATVSDKKKIKSVFLNRFGIDEKVLLSSIIFYNSLREKLNSSIEINNSDSLKGIFEKLNIGDTKTIYLLEETPNKIYKFSSDDIFENWENLWTPPSSDAIVVYVPGTIVIMITHYNIVHYQKIDSE